jgi:hypothetical protein
MFSIIRLTSLISEGLGPDKKILARWRKEEINLMRVFDCGSNHRLFEVVEFKNINSSFMFVVTSRLLFALRGVLNGITSNLAVAMRRFSSLTEITK